MSSLALMLAAQSDGGSDWWPTLLAAFGGAIAGAGIGGWLTYRQRLRSARSTLYAARLYHFHDEVNARRRIVERGSAPFWTGGRGVDEVIDRDRDTALPPKPSLGAMFSEFDRDAATANRFDAQTVRAIWPKLERINTVHADCQSARRAEDERPNGERTRSDEELQRDYAAQQLPLWVELNDYLWAYRYWLEWKATRIPIPWLRGKPRSRPPDPDDVAAAPRQIQRMTRALHDT